MKTHRAVVRSPWSHYLLVSLVFSLGFSGPDSIGDRNAPIVLAEGMGNPWISMTDGYAVHTRSVIGSNLDVAMYRSGSLVPLSIAQGDWNRDGVTDLVAGYRSGGRGLLAVRPGRFDPLAGHLPGDAVLVYGLEDPPELLAAGDFDADGYQDVLAASRFSTRLALLAGNGTASLRPASYRPVSGQVTALHVADLGAPDGLPDIAIGVSVDGRSGIEIHQSPSGAFNGAPVHLDIGDGPVSAIASGLTDLERPRALAVASGSSVHLVATGGTHAAITKLADRLIPFGASVADIAVGNFTGSDDHDVAVLTSAGRLAILDVDASDRLEIPYTLEGSEGALSVSAVWSSSGGKKDLAILNRDESTLTFLHEDHIASAQSRRSASNSEGAQSLTPAPAPVEVPITRHPVALLPTRSNRDAFDDLVILTGSSTETPALTLTLSTPMTTLIVDDPGMDGYAYYNNDECRTRDGGCTYPLAVNIANDRPGHDEIVFSIPQIVTGTAAGSPIAKDATTVNGIQGNGAKLVVAGPRNHLHFWEGSSNSTVLNVIAGGLFMTDSDNLVVQNNWLGITANGDSLDAPQYSALRLFDGANAQIGGRNPDERNHLSFMLVGRFHELVAEGNTIGTKPSGSELLLRPDGISSNDGIDVSDGSHNRLGGPEPGAGNLVHGGHSDGISVTDESHVTIQGNMIGTDIDGYTALSPDQTGDGIYSRNNSVVLIGGSVRGAGNLISGAEDRAILVEGDSTTIQGNWIGTTSSGGGAIGNGDRGIEVYKNSTFTQIGGSETAEQGNIIVASDVHGISIGAVAVESNTVIEGNYIGTSPYDPVDLGNGSGGINLYGSKDVVVGGPDPSQRNVIAFNDENGVAMYSDAFGNSILGNSIHSNDLLGIGSWTPYPNDPGDADTGPNGRQNFPELTVNDDGTLNVALSSTPSTTFRIELFANRMCDPSGHGEGETFLETFDLTTDGSGQVSTTVDVLPNPGSEFITATATDPLGNTSEFSVCASVPTINAFVVKVMQDSLKHDAQPIPLVEFEYGTIDSKNEETILGTQTSNADGLLFLPDTDFSPGQSFFLRTHKKDRAATRSNHVWVDDLMYRVTVDNLIVNKLGRITADKLATNPADTTVTYLGHTMIGFHLMVGIEWKAPDSYVESMKSAFQKASNFLFDVTNGQAYLRMVTVFDDAEYWKSVDLRFDASNTSWPRATVNGILSSTEKSDARRHIYMPPKFFGSPTTTIDGSYTEYPLNLTSNTSISTIIHELGHYGFGLYDEYLNADDKKIYPSSDPDHPQPSINFGFMDSQGWSDDMGSEMSAFVTDEYKETAQFAKRGRVAWDFFRDRYRDVSGPVRAEIHTPALLGMRHPELVYGPDRFVDLDIGARLEFRDLTTDFDGQIYEYQVVDAETKDPIPAAWVSVGKGFWKWTKLGKTVIQEGENQGKIRLRGGEVGDWIFLLENEKGDDYKALAKVVEPPATKTGEVEIIELPAVTFAGGLLGRVVTTDGTHAEFQLSSHSTPLSSPVLRAIPGTGDAIPVEGGPLEFSAQLPDDLESESTLLVESRDETGVDFFVPFSLNILSVDTAEARVSPPGQALELYINPESVDLETLAITGSPFPGPEEGLPDSMARVSDIFSIDGFPTEAPMSIVLSLYYDADRLLPSEESAVDIYRWNGDQWSAMPTDVTFDTLLHVAATTVTERGHYAAYLDLTKAIAVGIEDDGLGLLDGPVLERLERPYPNPFRYSTSVGFGLTETSHVRLEVFDILGRRVGLLLDETRQPGRHTVRFTPRSLPSGSYFIRLNVDGVAETVPVTLTD